AMALASRDCAAPEPPQFPHEPQVEGQADDSMLHQQFEICVVGVECGLVVSLDKSGKRGRHLMKTPACQRMNQKHLPAARIDGSSVVDRTLFLETVAECAIQFT